MAIVIHTRKGKYQYAYEHTREGDKVISRYMYPVNDRGDKIKQYRGKVTQQKDITEKEVAQHTLPISKIFCDKCKKAFPSQTSITEKGITRYMVNGKVTGYSFKHKRPIKKISCVSGIPVENEVYTLKFYCKKCYGK